MGLFGRQGDSAAGGGGLAGRGEDADDGDVGIERGEVAVGVEAAVEDSYEVVERVILRDGEGGCGFGVLFLFAVEAEAEVVGDTG